MTHRQHALLLGIRYALLWQAATQRDTDALDACVTLLDCATQGARWHSGKASTALGRLRNGLIGARNSPPCGDGDEEARAMTGLVDQLEDFVNEHRSQDLH